MQKNSEQIIRELTNKIKELEFQLQKAKDNAGYGLKREEKPEIFEERAQNALPVLKEKNELFIDNQSDLDHLIIEWDNYHSLSSLSYTHKGKIDLIYIDPPYNTGNKDFVYNDNYVDSEDNYRHSKWLSFMNKRLRLAKDLLSDEGVIFISIDDNEQANLKLLCDQIFGESFVETNIWSLIDKSESTFEKTAGNTTRKEHEYIITCRKHWWIKFKKYHENLFYENSNFSNPDNDSRGERFSGNISRTWIKTTTGSKYYTIETPSGKQYTRNRTLSKEEYQEALFNNRIYFPKDWDWVPRYKIFATDTKETIQSSIFSDLKTSISGKNTLKDLFGSLIFTYPKPVDLIKRLLQLVTTQSAIILDFFAGSGTTGHAVLELNKQDWGSRQFILCSNAEATDAEPEKNICRNITYERVKRVMQGYTNAKGDVIQWLWGGNLRYYTTEFIKKEKAADDLRQKFIYLCDELLCIKEDTFTVLNSDYCSDQLRCYYKKDHYTVILYDVWQMDKLQQLIAGLNGQISLYLFSLSKDAYEEELLVFRDKVKIENVPDDILETYHKIF